MEINELLKKIHQLEIKSKGLTKHIFSGEYHSAFKGRGMTFSEVRNYQFGDEVRTIDWNVTARFNDPFVKVFEEERELTVMFIIDISASENFGTQTKSKKDILLETVATLAFSALSNNDKVGALLITDHVERYFPPKKGRKHVLHILRELIQMKPQHKGTNLENGFRFFNNIEKKRTICFVISDFLDDSTFVDGLKLINRRHDVIALKLEDPSEYQLPKMGFVKMKNAESGTTTWVNTNDEKVRVAYRDDYIEQRDKLLLSLDKSGISNAVLNTESDHILPIINLFRNR
ncbi:MAG TPA: DUF58 domain-containing protein [Taishania sp.]|nr:DUF58 domain-containing protein [Taishania sp.]